MAPDSSTLAWKILWTEEPGRLQSMGSLRVGHDSLAYIRNSLRAAREFALMFESLILALLLTLQLQDLPQRLMSSINIY